MKKSMTLTAAALLCALSAALCAMHFVTTRGEGERARKMEMVLAEFAYAELSRSVREPLLLGRAVARNSFLLDFLGREGEDARADGAKMAAHLSRLRKEFGCGRLSVVSRATRRYYRDDGILKVMDPENDPVDAWFLQCEQRPEILQNAVVYTPKGGDEFQSVLFVNVRMEDDAGRFVGVASPEIPLRGVIERIRSIERRFGIKVDVTDSSGLVLLSSKFSDVYSASLKGLLPPAPDTEFRRVRDDESGFAVVKYVDSLGWYFVVRGAGDPGGFGGGIFYISALAMLAATIATLWQTRSMLHASAWRRASPGSAGQEDKLTGLPNRNFFKAMFGERGVFNTTRYKCLAVFDIDFFKEANDNMNGDEALLSVVHAMTDLLQNRGLVLRWGGDEFLVLFEPPMESSFAICRQFVRNVETAGLVTVSVGLTSVRISDTIKKNYYRAAQYCYVVKEMGGNGVKKD